MSERVYTTGEIAKLCSVAVRTVVKWIDTGILNGYRLPGGGSRYVRQTHLQAFLDKHGMNHVRL